MAFDSYEMTPRGRRSSFRSSASSVTEVDSYSLNDLDAEKRDAQQAAAAGGASGGEPGEHLDPMELLPEHESSILKAQIDIPEKKYGAGALYAFATRLDFAIIIVSGIASAASGAALPCMTIIFGGLQGVFMDYISLGTMTLDDFKNEMVEYVLYFIYLAIGTFVCSYISNVGFIYTGEHIANNLRKAYLTSCLRQNIGYYDAVGVGEIVNRVTADALTVQEGISEKVGMLINAVFTFLTGFIIGFIKFWKLTLILCSTLVALFLNTSIASKFLVKYSTPMIMSITEGAILGDEVFSSIRVALAFGIQERMIKTYDNYLKDAHKWGLNTKITVAMMLAVTMSLTNLTYGLGFWQGSTFVARRELELENLITTMMAVTVGAFQMGSIGPSFHAFTSSVSSASKMLNTIHRDTTIDSAATEGTKLPDLKGNIRLEGVKHIYPSRPEVVVMDGVSLNIPAGKTTALVGASGSGKSTIVGLIERFYMPVGGRVLLDGHDVSTLNLKWLRQQIALVGQEPALFACTIMENIKYGLIGTPYEHATEHEQRERIVEAAKMANAHEFVSQLPDGYNTNVGDRGFLLSGGQKQRIAIARAIVSDPKILLLDEATSALDTKSEGVVQAALENAAEGRTTITIAHRLSTVRQAHNIVVMNQGKIVEQGTHKELLAKKGSYYTLVSAQTIEDTNKAKVEAALEPLDEEEEKLIRRMSRWKNVGGYLTDPADVAENHALRHQRASRASMAGRKSLKSMRSVKSVSEGAIARQRGNLTEQEPNYSLATILSFIAGFNKREWYWMLAGLACSVICGGANPVQAVFFAKQVDTLSTMDIPGNDRWDVQGQSNFWSLMYLMLGGVQFLANLCQGWTLGICGEWLGRRVKLQTFSSLLRQDVSFFDQEKNNSGALTAFLCIETTAVIGVSGATLGTILVSITSVVSGIAVSVAIGWKLALVCSSVVPVVIACGFFRTKMLAHYNARTAHVYGESAAYAAENISQMKTVASLTREDQVAQKYCDELDQQMKRSLKSVTRSSILFAASQSVMFLCFALGFWYGSTLIATMEYNQFQFYVCFNSIIFGAQSAGTFFSFAPDMAKAKNSSVNLKRLFERQPAIDTWEPEGRRLERVKGHLEFKNVHFRYPTRPEQPVLRGVNLKVRPGQYVAFVGASGCGKSTSIGLLERFYDPLVGQILIDGNDVSKVNINDYRSHIALVSQEPTLYQGTIRDNIVMGSADENVSDALIEKACRDANIQEFIMSLPEGLNTVVGAKGGLLSGGQKQRIAIARALVRQPKILLLDEATSALDSESEHVVQEALDKAAKGRTTITIAHRLSTVQHADVIFVFDAGRVVEAGTHDELMDINGRYAELVKLQSLGAS